VTDGSPAAKAGLKAGDIIETVNGATIQSRADLVRALNNATDPSMDVVIVIVRERKQQTVQVHLEPPERQL